jgi:hypothetical protein
MTRVFIFNYIIDEILFNHKCYGINDIMKVHEPNFSLKKDSNRNILYGLCREAVNKNGLFLEDVPNKFKTYEICWNAVKQNEDALEFVKEKFKTPEFFKQIRRGT